MVTTERDAVSVSENLLSGEILAKLGVQIRNRFDQELECMTCGTTWSPQLTPDGKLPAGYWKCPSRCNW